MNDVALRTVGLGKLYHIGGERAQYRTLRDTLAQAAKHPLERIRHPGAATHHSEALWALKDVDLEVKHGEVLGRVEIAGRVASLLEVGTGFHPELTGRENIQLNGSILGMSRAEIRGKFDEIVDFSEIGRFLDTPVKRYSSGMYVRLAFAVAAHLDPEILIVDEVLSVGDAEFQKKCLGKMEDVAGHGRTVLFVSHNMAAVKALCTRAILIQGGRVTVSGAVDSVVDAYLGRDVEGSRTGVIPADVPRFGTGAVILRELHLLTEGGEPVHELYFGQRFRVGLTFEARKPVEDAVVELGVATRDGVRVASAFSTDAERPPFQFDAGANHVVVDVDVTLLPRDYHFDVAVHHGEGVTLDEVERAFDFEVLNVAETGADHYRWSSVRGFVRPAAQWRLVERG
jgi:lipopolysaccharide transport system ATP-binding protein